MYFQDVLSEIQRLKQEAKRFIAILSQESDDETLSPTKRQSLTREVESLQVNLLCRKALLVCSGCRHRSLRWTSYWTFLETEEETEEVYYLCVFLLLQLVVEMRTNELHQLRDERDRHLQQLEEFDSVKSNLVKMSARVEDLQAQLAEKTKLER